jgi:hypothetical protein
LKKRVFGLGTPINEQDIYQKKETYAVRSMCIFYHVIRQKQEKLEVCESARGVQVAHLAVKSRADAEETGRRKAELS